MKAKYGIDPAYIPDVSGLDTLCISGSAQFQDLADSLRACAVGRTVYVIDLRQESRVLLNEGIPLSWYGSHNWANAGMTSAEAEADEAACFGGMIGTTVSAFAREDDTPINETRINIQSVTTERELVGREGFVYVRLAIQDHIWPTPEEIDDFIRLVRDLDPDQVWLHFHCQAGKGRTGIMMMIYDMMRNPDVAMEDIAIRHTMLGGSYPRKTLALQDAYTENFDASTGRNPGSGRTVLEFTGLNTPVGTLTVNGESDTKSLVKFTVDMKDDTYKQSYRTNIASLEAITGDSRSKTIPCNFSGTVYDLRISFDTADGETVTVSSVEINRPISVHVSLMRLMLMMLLCAAVWFCCAPGRLPKKSLKPLAAALTACLLIFATYMTNMYRYTVSGHSLKNDFESHYGNQISQEIVDAFEAGRVTLDQTPNDDILSLENPYDGSQRDASGAYYLWDHLLYDGKYYSYYGIAPVLVLFLPYHLLTG